jgi:3-deoxy-D-manno-octulosonic-acid transferase
MGYILLFVYNLLAPAAALAYLFLFFLSSRRGLLRNLPAELKERLALGAPVFSARPLWIHAASVGEVRSLKTLIPLLRERRPLTPVLITTSTAAGKAEAARLTPYARLLPLDSYPLMRRFISTVRPELLLIAETELWPNLICAASAAGVKIMMINARISGRTLGFYKFLSPVSRLIFGKIAKIAAQSAGDLERFRLLPGLTGKPVLTGNIKHDLVCAGPQDRGEVEAFIRQAGWKGKKIFCAGSTHPGEEGMILEAFLKVKAAIPDARLILAPRHPETAAASSARLSEKGIAAPRWSRRSHARMDPDALLVDEIGRLADLYSFSDVVFVGGTLDGTGGHNVLEPAAFSKPVLFGPDIRHTLDGALALMNMNGGFMVKTADELAGKIIRLLKDPASLAEAGAASKTALESLQGATARTLTLIETA